jgi:CRP-like cAMP-binding protein
MQGMGSGDRFWELLTRDEQRDLVALGRDKKYPPGATMCMEGDPASHVFVLLDGWAKFLSVTDDGHEKVLGLRGDGDIFGETAGETTGRRNATMRAINTVHVLMVSYDRFSSFFDTHTRASHAYRRMMTQRVSDADMMLRRREVTSGAQRLAGLLLDLAGGEANGAMEVALPLSQEELADLAGASRATVTRALRNWRKRGFIRTGQRRIAIIDASGLRQVAGPAMIASMRLPDQMEPSSSVAPKNLSVTPAVPSTPLVSPLVDNPIGALASAYQAALANPIIPAGEMLAGLEIPTLQEGYIDHRIRIAEVTPSAELGRESWWKEVPVWGDACRFLVARLTKVRHVMTVGREDSTGKSRQHLPSELSAPLILLGQPGSGKSVLTRILAARLAAAADFLPIRVELRKSPTEADLQHQIELAVRSATGESVEWPRLVESSNSALPVVMLDGFDELLQATGVEHNNFLERVQEFQEREANLDRPVVVIVTSRTVVTDRVRIPVGATAIRLEPFSREQTAAWLKVWERANHISLDKRGMRPLPVAIALNYEELAEQPLLLLMLALYDADSNALQRRSAALGRTELYGRLLKDFASREIRKHFTTMPEAELESAVEAELRRLSVIAFAMFNRRSQWVREADIDTDLRELRTDGDREMPETGRLETQLTAAQLVVGRFFFVHESQETRTYEFLHATFGEFLVARLVVQVLGEMVASGVTRTSAPLSEADDGMLYALLSFAALTARGPVVAFVGDLLGQLDAAQRKDIADMLLRLHTRALFPHVKSPYSGYEPLRLTVTARHSAWSANLVVLAVLAASPISGTQLFPQEADPVLAWRKEAMMWRSQLSGYGWEGLYEMISLDRVWDDGHREFHLSRNDGTFTVEAPDMYWIYNIPPDPAARKGFFSQQAHNSHMMQRKINFVCNMSEDTMAHGLVAVTSSFPAVANVFVILDEDRVVSAVHALLSVLYAPFKEDTSEVSVYRDLAHVTSKLVQVPNIERDSSYLKVSLTVLLLAVEQGSAPAESLEPLAGLASNTIPDDAELSELLARLDRLLSGSG